MRPQILDVQHQSPFFSEFEPLGGLRYCDKALETCRTPHLLGRKPSGNIVLQNPLLNCVWEHHDVTFSWDGVYGARFLQYRHDFDTIFIQFSLKFMFRTSVGLGWVSSLTSVQSGSSQTKISGNKQMGGVFLLSTKWSETRMMRLQCAMLLAMLFYIVTRRRSHLEERAKQSKLFIVCNVLL